jgi:proteic killer suppression protein
LNALRSRVCWRILLDVISSFADKATSDLFSGADTKEARRRLSKELWPVARRKLDWVNEAKDVADLKVPPSNRLKPLSGDMEGKWSIRINAQYRIIFAWSAGNASDVQVIDYH